MIKQRILIIKTRQSLSRLEKLLQKSDIEVNIFNTTEIFPVNIINTVENTILNDQLFTVVFISDYLCLEYLLKNLNKVNLFVNYLKQKKIIVFDNETVQLLRKNNIDNFIIIDKISSIQIFDKLQQYLGKENNILYFQGDNKRNELLKLFFLNSFKFKLIPVFKPKNKYYKDSELLNTFKNLDIILFPSSGSVINFLNSTGTLGQKLLKNSKIVTMGPITTDTCKAHNISVDFQTQHATIESVITLLDSLKDRF